MYSTYPHLNFSSQRPTPGFTLAYSTPSLAVGKRGAKGWKRDGDYDSFFWKSASRRNKDEPVLTELGVVLRYGGEHNEDKLPEVSHNINNNNNNSNRSDNEVVINDLPQSVPQVASPSQPSNSSFRRSRRAHYLRRQISELESTTSSLFLSKNNFSNMSQQINSITDAILTKKQRFRERQRQAPREDASDMFRRVSGKSLPSSLVEYDPWVPNDYDDIMREREALRAKQRMEEEERKENEWKDEEKRKWEESEKQRLQLNRVTEGSNVSGEAAFMRRVGLSKQMGSRAALQVEREEAKEKKAKQLIQEEASKKMSFAERMLRKQGWEEGKGLGKNEDGRTLPLNLEKLQPPGARKSGPVKGVIKTAEPEKKNKRRGTTKLQGTPTKVVLLRNMVTTKDVDSELRSEVADECARYGIVKNVSVFVSEVADTPENGKVRIFVKFERIPEAMKAVIELDGRTFAGRVVSACFYDETKYDLSLLDVQSEEPPLPLASR